MITDRSVLPLITERSICRYIYIYIYISTGRVLTSAAGTALIPVLVTPFSLLVKHPTCLAPYFVRIFMGLCTAVNPVSSTLDILFGVCLNGTK